MAGLALLVQQQETLSDQGGLPAPRGLPASEFREFIKKAAAYKGLQAPPVWSWAEGETCAAARLDAPCSLHRTVARDSATGSWMMAAGTVIDSASDCPDGSLDKLLADYLSRGEAVFARLDGQFALALYDGRSRTTLVVSDPLGMIPIYYTEKGGQYLISTSALAVVETVQPPVNPFGVRAFILYASTFGDTLWEGVYMLPPASVLKIGDAGTRLTRYWSFEVDPEVTALGEHDAVECMIEALAGSLRRSLDSGQKVWVSLTGGLDSRTLAALVHHSRVPFKAYCHGPRDSRDVQIAEQISGEMGWDYEYFPLPEDWGAQRVDWFDSVFGQTDGLLNIIKMSRTIREQTIKAQQLGVSLWGYGGELHRGIYWRHEFWRAGRSPAVNYDLLMDYRVIPADWSALSDGARWKVMLREEIKDRLRKEGEQNPGWLNTVKLNVIGMTLERHACGTTIASVLGHQRVVLPYYFKEVIARSFSINPRWCGQGRMFRLILERLTPWLADMEIANGGPALPMRASNFYRFIPYWVDTGEKVLWRAGVKAAGRPLWKQRNAGTAGKAYPIGAWLQDTLSRLNERGLLSPDKMVSAGLYSASHLEQLARGAEGGKPDDESMLGRVLAVEMALRAAG